MKLLITSFVLLAFAVQAAENFPIKSGNGISILSPVDKTMVDVKVCSKIVKIPTGMVYVPAGKFTFGEGETRELSAFAIARFEVTNAEYKAFIDATGHRGAPRYWKDGEYPKEKDNHPVLFVSLEDAEAYCAWIKEKTGWNMIVPSAEQWEKAARGPKGGRYPWGDDKDSKFSGGKLKSHFNYNAVCAAYMLQKEAKTITSYVDKSDQAGQKVRVADITSGNGKLLAVTADGGVDAWIDHSTHTGFVNTQIYRDLVANGGFTTPVGSFASGASHYGCYDMAGNAYEWTSSVIVATNGQEKGKEVNDVRGGSWYSTGRSGMSLCTGEGRNRSAAYHSVGFRIAMDLPEVAKK
jgi:formylglycine-generating enzyme required for sulfatase activity